MLLQPYYQLNQLMKAILWFMSRCWRENCFHREFVHEELSANRGLKQAYQTLVTWRNELCSRTFSFDLLIFLECFNPDLLSKDRFAISPKFFQRRSIGLLSNWESQRFFLSTLNLCVLNSFPKAMWPHPEVPIDQMDFDANQVLNWMSLP